MNSTQPNMPMYFVCPTSNSETLLKTLASQVPRLYGIVTDLRRDCLQTATEIYETIPTQDVPIPTILLHEFQCATFEDSGDLRSMFPNSVLMDHLTRAITSTETVDIFEQRISAAIRIAMKMGPNVVIVAPSSVIQHWAGVTLNAGELYEYSDECSYYEQCEKELVAWSTSS